MQDDCITFQVSVCILNFNSTVIFYGGLLHFCRSVCIIFVGHDLVRRCCSLDYKCIVFYVISLCQTT